MAEKKKMRCGDMAVVLNEEKILWMDRKRVTIFALPWSFTKYQLTPSRLLISIGLINQREDEIRLYRVKDVSYTQSIWERIGNVGTLHVISTDASVPSLELKHIKNARKVKDVLSQAIEVSRRENGVRTSELISSVGSHTGNEDNPETGAEPGEALGPDMAPDFDGDGVDDRLQ